MAIFHLKYSYLNWKAIPCKRKMTCVFVVFSSFFFQPLFLFLVEFFKCMTWQSIFLLFFFVYFVVCLLWATTHTIDDLPSWSISSHVRIVLRGWPFGPKLFISFLSKEKIMAQKRSWEMGNFWSTCLKASIRVISEYHDFRDLCFAHWKGLKGLKL